MVYRSSLGNEGNAVKSSLNETEGRGSSKGVELLKSK